MKPENKLTKLIENIDVRPDDAYCRQTLEAMRKAQSSAQAVGAAPSIWRNVMKTKVPQLTAVAAVIVIAVVWTQLAFVQPTFADIVKPILNAQTLVYDFVTGPEESGTMMHDIVKGSRIRRTISTMPDMTMVLDTEKARMLHLDEKEMKATYFDMKGPLGLGTEGFLKFVRETIRQMQTNTEPQFAPINLGTNEIDGKKVIGYAAGGSQKVEIWADVKTSLPVRIVLGIGPQITTLKNFQFDVPVDDALVSMDVPPGYTLEQAQMDLSDATEEDFVAGLKVWATVLRDGTFPEDITNDQFMKQVPLLESAIGKLDIPEQEARQLGTSFIKGMMFVTLFEAKGHNDWHYAGSGVKVGDASKAIFWYRPKDAQQYRVLYGDLRVEDVPADQLPQ